ncbi:MAG: AhpC/TSA family protein [Fimbriimonadaceae bacterium]
MSKLSQLRHEISAGGTQLAFVHMGAEVDANAFFSEYGLEVVPRFASPDQELYRKFGLNQGSVTQLMNFRTLTSSIGAFREGHRQGKTAGDPAQMPGAFLISGGQVVRSFIARFPGEMVDFVTFSSIEVGL